MKKYSKTEFAKQIRDKYPNSYDDLDDNKLIELWLKKFPDDENKINKKSILIRYKYLFFFLVLFGAFISYGIYLEFKYPNNELELQNLLCDKYWKIKEGKIEEIYINNKLIPRTSSNLSNNLIAVIDSSERLKNHTNNELYDYLEKELLSQKNQDSYIFFKNNTDLCVGDFNYSYYDQYYDSENLSLLYTETCMKLEKSDIGNFTFKSKENQDVFEYNLVEDDSEETTIVNSYFIKSYSIKIEYLDKENLDLSVSITIIDSEKQEFKIIHALSYELSQGKTNPQELVK